MKRHFKFMKQGCGVLISRNLLIYLTIPAPDIIPGVSGRIDVLVNKASLKNMVKLRPVIHYDKIIFFYGGNEISK